MSNWTVFKCWVVLLAPLIFHRNAEAIPDDEDWNRVRYTYSPITDPCYFITDTSGPSARESADRTCAQAFEALNRLEGSYCAEWRDPGCRQYPGHPHFQCTIKKATTDLNGVKHYFITTFRNCARIVQEEERRINELPSPPSEFWDRFEEITNDAWEYKATRSREPKPARKVPGEGPSNVSVELSLGGSKAPRKEPARTSPRSGSSKVSTDFSLGTKTYRTRESCARSVPGEGTSGGVSVDLTIGVGDSRPAGPSLEFELGVGNRDGPNTRRKTLKQYKCDICDNESTSTERLADHMRLHGGGTTCEYCGKRFSNRAALRVHYGPCARAHKPGDHPTKWTLW